MYQAWVITLMGMGWVFIFLLLLIYAMKILAWTLDKINSPRTAAGKGPSSDLKGVTQAKILAALKARSLLP